MITKVIMPKLSDAMETGKVIKWLKKEGETVKGGDVLVEVETDKANVEVEAFGSGVLIVRGDGSIDQILARQIDLLEREMAQARALHERLSAMQMILAGGGQPESAMAIYANPGEPSCESCVHTRAPLPVSEPALDEREEDGFSDWEPATIGCALAPISPRGGTGAQ